MLLYSTRRTLHRSCASPPQNQAKSDSKKTASENLNQSGYDWRCPDSSKLGPNEIKTDHGGNSRSPGQGPAVREENPSSHSKKFVVIDLLLVINDQLLRCTRKSQQGQSGREKAEVKRKEDKARREREMEKGHKVKGK